MKKNKNLLQYSINTAITIAELYSKNESYNNVRCSFREYGLNITRDFKEKNLNYRNFSPDERILIVVNAEHITMKQNAMKPEIKFEYIPKTSKTCIDTAYIMDEFNEAIDISSMKISNSEHLGKVLYKLMIDTQKHYEQKLINS